MGIETVLNDYLAGSSPEEIAVRYRDLSLEQVYGTITYYLRYRAKVEAYLEAKRQDVEQTGQEPEESKASQPTLYLRERIENQQRMGVAEVRVDYRLSETITELESYFEFLSEEDIRIKGTRVGIETILNDYLEGASPEEITARYRSPSLEQVYATITYYLHNQAEVDAYLEAWRQYTDQAYEESKRNPSDVVKRLRRLKEASTRTTGSLTD